MSLEWGVSLFRHTYYNMIIDSFPWYINCPIELLPILDGEAVNINENDIIRNKTITYIDGTFEVIIDRSNRRAVYISRDGLEKFIGDGLRMYTPMQKL